jgi:hypothetical protein
VIKAVLVRVKTLGKIGISRREIVQKFGADLENVAAEAIVLRVGDLVSLVLIYNENIVVVHVIYLTANEEAFAARKAKKGLWSAANPINPYQWRKAKH